MIYMSALGAIGRYCSGASPTPFKGVILSGNLFDLLGRVKAVGKDLTFYGDYVRRHFLWRVSR